MQNPGSVDAILCAAAVVTVQTPAEQVTVETLTGVARLANDATLASRSRRRKTFLLIADLSEDAGGRARVIG